VKILEVIHGYPPLYNAGSEVYTQTIARGFAKAGHEVAIFTRDEDPYRPDFDIRCDNDLQDTSIRIYYANHARSRDRYRHVGMDDAFFSVLVNEKPDVVHIGHLNHLSTGIPEIASRSGALVVYTIHDFWLACPRGQFIQMGLGEPEIWKLCPGQDNRGCAIHCMSRMWGGMPNKIKQDIVYWTKWVKDRMIEVQNQIDHIDLFIAPSKHIQKRMVTELDINPHKMVLEPYGFDISRIAGRRRERDKGVVFGYIGRINASKGIDLLLKAFSKTHGDAYLRIYGRESFPDISALKRIEHMLKPERRERIRWMPEYRNEDIITSVFNHIDVVVVPSIWDENSPLVIHEAQQAGIPVITADHGGMVELVENNVNGFIFKHRDVNELSKRLQDAIDNPEYLISLGKRGYLNSADGRIPDIDGHVVRMMNLFDRYLGMKTSHNRDKVIIFRGESSEYQSDIRALENYV
jgi:glycosyltransferase involved in cell wall biosynthesis